MGGVTGALGANGAWARARNRGVRACGVCGGRCVGLQRCGARVWRCVGWNRGAVREESVVGLCVRCVGLGQQSCGGCAWMRVGWWCVGGGVGGVGMIVVSVGVGEVSLWGARVCWGPSEGGLNG